MTMVACEQRTRIRWEYDVDFVLSLTVLLGIQVRWIPFILEMIKEFRTLYSSLDLLAVLYVCQSLKGGCYQSCISLGMYR